MTRCSSLCLFCVSLFLCWSLARATFDEFMTCDRFIKSERTARVLEQIPCDMSKHGYCKHKGNAYPEAKIKMFQHDNLGLMKRLYGDMESHSIYREMRSVNSHSNGHRRFEAKDGEADEASALEDQEQLQLQQEAAVIPLVEKLGPFASLEYNIRLGSGLATVQSAREPVVSSTTPSDLMPAKRKVIIKKRRPAAVGPDTTTTTPVEAPVYAFSNGHTPPEVFESLVLTESDQQTTTTTDTSTLPSSHDYFHYYHDNSAQNTTSTTTTTTTTTNILAHSDTGKSAVQKLYPKNSSSLSAALDTPWAGGVAETTTAASATLITTSTTDPDPSTSSSPSSEHDDDDDNDDSDTTVTMTTTEESEPTTLLQLHRSPLGTTSNPVQTAPTVVATSTPAPASVSNSDTMDNMDETQTFDIGEILENAGLGDLEHLVGDLVGGGGGDSDHVDSEPALDYPSVDMEGGDPMLSGDDYHSDITSTGEEEILPPYDFSGPSINACPVKEEVFAPYWANNTRDQVLALLNLYPFEQYIHMETCQYEEEQMLCRDGCRCEQQYRLHRLLAFDPSNECRGIFSDWFRFPSYCICKCYNVAEELFPQRRKPKTAAGSNDPAKQADEPEDGGGGGNSHLKDIPPHLPHEAKQAMLRDMRRLEEAEAEALLTENEDEIRTNQVPKGPDDHFFYSNAPVLEYQLSDGSGGSVKQTPRKRRRK